MIAGAGVFTGSGAGGTAEGGGDFLKKLNIGRFLEYNHSMKRALTLLGLVACLSAGAENSVPAASTSSAVSRAPISVPVASGVQQFTLANGMQLIIQPDRRAPTAVHMLWVRVGSMDEVSGTTGVAHVLEHMMFKGSKSLAAGEFSRRVAALGGRDNAFTSRDYTGYYQQIPSQRLEDVMRLESDRFANNSWPDEEFRKELEVVKEERRMRTDDQPRAALFEQLYAAAYIASPYRQPVVGWMSDLDSLEPGDARSFYRKWYVPANAAVVVAGDVDVAQVRTWAEKYYGRIPVKATPTRKPQTEPLQKGLRRIAVKLPAEQAYVALGFKVPGISQLETLGAQDKDGLALLVLSAVLSGYDGARLERALEQGPQRVADAAGSSASVLGRGPSMFMLTGVPAAGKTTAEVEAALREQVQRVARDGVDATELERVKTQWIAGNIYERDSVFSQAQGLGSYWTMKMPVNAEELLLQHLKQVTSAQVQDVAARYFGDDQLTIATLVPQPLDPNQPRRPAPAAGGLLH